MSLDPKNVPEPQKSLSDLSVPAKRHQAIYRYEEVPAGEENIVTGDKDGYFAGELLIGGRFAAVCDIGFQKELRAKPGKSVTNEDGYFKIEVDNKVFLCVADGVGGQPAGEEACRVFLSTLKRNLSSSGAIATIAIRNAAKSLEYAHQFCRDNAHYIGEDTANMGLCFTLAEIEKHSNNKKTVTFHNCGDCRGYLKSGDLVWHTTDDTEAEKHNIYPGNPNFSDSRATVNQFITLKDGTLDEEFFIVERYPTERLRKGDQLILASDGLWDCLKFRDTTVLDDLIDKTEAGPKKQKHLVQNIGWLIKDSILLRSGKRDNLAVIAAEF